MNLEFTPLRCGLHAWPVRIAASLLTRRTASMNSCLIPHQERGRLTIQHSIRFFRWKASLPLLLCCVGVSANAVELSVRDSQTGASVDAALVAVSLSDPSSKQGVRAQITASGQDVSLPVGRWQLTFVADGYRTLRTTLGSGGEDNLPLTILLDPIVPSATMIEAARRASDNPTHGWLQGHVRLADTAAPVVGARVSAHHASAMTESTLTDADGHFVLDLGEIANARNTVPDGFELVVEADGHVPYTLSGLPRVAGLQQRLISIGAAIPALRNNEIGARDQRWSSPPIIEHASQASSLEPQPSAISAALLAPPLTPPATIRVGYTDAACTIPCCTNACSNVCTLSLETYVRRGLDSEWIASWNTQSLRAGSIAYRSYGAWRVDNPIRAQFDICSSACCQVNDAGTSTSTDAAVARTPGILLTRNASTAFSSEYSAENNSWDDPNDGLSCSNADLSCGNGNVGSPSAGWPCLADAVALNRGCFGHGRGMSQWGTQRWAINATPQRWKWIVDHYYNDNGNQTGAGSGQRTAQMTSPLSLSSISAMPSTVAPGDTLQIAATASNAAGADHGHLLIGASLYRSGVGYLDDSTNDSALILAPGSHSIQRSFAVPSTAPLGSYDVLLSLYLDVDEDGAISAADLPMALMRADGVLTITVPTDRIFADGFETFP